MQTITHFTLTNSKLGIGGFHYSLWRCFFIVFFLCGLIGNNYAQVVINEVLPNGTVELKNNGDATVDVSTYWLCNFPAYEQIGSLTLECGSTALEPGAILAVNNFTNFNATDGEMGLYINSSFGDPSAIIDYVEWGSTGHERSSVAVSAGTWTAGEFVAPFVAGQSIAFDGNGDSASDWNIDETPSICEDNDEIVDGRVFKAYLTGRNEVLPIATLAFGEVEAVLENNQLVIEGYFQNLSTEVDTNILGGAHVHLGYAGQNGGVELLLDITFDGDLQNGTFEAQNNTFSLSDEQLKALEKRQLYINIHTLNFGSGELRGQLTPASEGLYGANLFGSNEVPVFMTQGHGAVMAELQGNELVVSGSFNDLEGDFAADVAGGAHIHLGMAGQNGGIELPLTTTVDADLRGGAFESDNNTFTLSDDQIAALKGRRLYVNIHSQRNRPGEIRGQLVSAKARTVFRAHLSGSNELPVVTTTATGMALVEIMNEEKIVASGSFNDLESDLAVDIVGGVHLHNGMAGMNGGIIVPINSNTADNRNGSFPAADNEFTLDTEDVLKLYSRGVYMNIHSEGNRPGELRGQFLPEKPINFSGFLSSIYEVPAASSRGLGGVKAELAGNQLVVSGAFANLSSPVAVEIAGGAHIHLGFAGATGGIQFPLQLTLDDDGQGGQFKADENQFDLTDEQVSQIRSRQFYVNIHSENIRPGELRGQLLNEATTYFVAPLSGTSELVPFDSDANGMAVVEINGNKGYLSGSFQNLQGELAVNIAGGVHIHLGMAGENGGIDKLINTTLDASNTSGAFEVSNNVFDVTDGFLDSLRNRMRYVNVHSAASPSGELRGQFLPLAMAYFTTTLASINEVPPATTPAIGALKFEVTGNRLTLSGRFANLTGAFDANIAGGSHIHLGMVGTNGGIEAGIVPDLDADLLGGAFKADENSYELSEEQIENLFAGNFYVNIHTQAIASGELRGQVLPEINLFPEDGFAITSPADGAALTIEGNGGTAFTATWDTSDDRDKLAYIWQLSATDDFSALLLQVNTGENTSFTTDFATVDALLEAAGLAIGESIQVYHRALASDGAVQTPGEAASVTLTRGVIVQEGADLELSIVASASEYDIYENTTFTIELTNNGPEAASNVIVSAGLPTGMVFTSSNTTAGNYELFFEEWTVDALGAGETATLELTLFTLVEGVEITNFVQVVASDQEDPDSTPDNNNNGMPTEDDEAAVTILPSFVPPMGGNDADLELSITTVSPSYRIYENVTYEITLTNNGPDAAANIIIAAGLPDGMVFTSSNTTAGNYELFFETWTVDLLEAGESATLTLALFPLVDDQEITNFVQVLASDQNDPDSTPDNNTTGVPAEDDEAAITVVPLNGLNTPFNLSNALKKELNSLSLFPVPAQIELAVELISAIEKRSVLTIYHANGQQMYQQAVQIDKGQNKWMLNIESLPSGVYSIKLLGEETIQTKQFIKID